MSPDHAAQAQLEALVRSLADKASEDAAARAALAMLAESMPREELTAQLAPEVPSLASLLWQELGAQPPEEETPCQQP